MSKRVCLEFSRLKLMTKFTFGWNPSSFHSFNPFMNYTNNRKRTLNIACGGRVGVTSYSLGNNFGTG